MNSAPSACYVDGTDLVVEIMGMFDITTADEILMAVKDALRSGQGAKRLVVDASGTPFVDSSGLAALLLMRYTAQEHGLRMVLRNPNLQLTQVLKFSGLEAQFDTA